MGGRSSPRLGRLACGAVGPGKMPEPDTLVQHILRVLALPHDLAGRRVLVTAGPTQESLDPVRYLTNHSTGKMGYAIARMAMLRGAEVTLISGPTALKPPPFVTVVPVISAEDMFQAVSRTCQQADFIFKAAAVADYTPAQYSGDKMKKRRTGSCPSLCPAPMTSSPIWGSTAALASSSAASPWRPGTW